MPENQRKDPRKEISRSEVENSIMLLKKAGFFAEYAMLPPQAIYDTLHQKRIQEAKTYMKEEHDPGMQLYPYEIAALDDTKMVYFDTEYGVIKGNNAYIELIERFGKATGGRLQPINISETWESDTGAIAVQFESKGEKIIFHPTYIDDWVADELFHTISEHIKGDSQFYVCIDEQSGAGAGQDIGCMYLTVAEKQFLEKTFGWELHKL